MKSYGWWGIFERVNFFYHFPCMNFFLDDWSNFFRVTAWIFFHLIFRCTNIFLYITRSPNKFSNGPSLSYPSLIQNLVCFLTCIILQKWKNSGLNWEWTLPLTIQGIWQDAEKKNWKCCVNLRPYDAKSSTDNNSLL